MMQHTCAGLIQALRVTRLARNHLGCSTLGHTNLRCVVIERLLLAILQVSTSVGLRDTVSLAEALHAPLAHRSPQSHSRWSSPSSSSSSWERQREHQQEQPRSQVHRVRTLLAPRQKGFPPCLHAGEALGAGLTPSECYSPAGCGHPPAAYPRR